MGPSPRTWDLWRSQKLSMGQGPRTRDLQSSWELMRQLGPSPRRPPRASLTKQSWGPRVQSSLQA
jgi:hypothetical protein